MSKRANCSPLDVVGRPGTGLKKNCKGLATQSLVAWTAPLQELALTLDYAMTSVTTKN